MLAGRRQGHWQHVDIYTCSGMIHLVPTNEKPLEWIGSSYKDLLALPADIRRFFGFALALAQVGDKHDAAKVLKGFGGAGVLEVMEDDAGGTYRAVYTVKFPKPYSCFIVFRRRIFKCQHIQFFRSFSGAIIVNNLVPRYGEHPAF